MEALQATGNIVAYLPAMNAAFGSHPIGLREWALIISASLVIYIVIELEKWLRRRAQ